MFTHQSMHSINNMPCIPAPKMVKFAVFVVKRMWTKKGWATNHPPKNNHNIECGEVLPAKKLPRVFCVSSHFTALYSATRHRHGNTPRHLTRPRRAAHKESHPPRHHNIKYLSYMHTRRNPHAEKMCNIIYPQGLAFAESRCFLA